MPNITSCLWFDTQGEDAARLYTSIFPNSEITDVARYAEGGPGPVGSAMSVSFRLDGHDFVAINGGPQYTFSEAVSFQINTESQDETDRYWDALSDGGKEGPCGWLKDRFGLSWQVVPNTLTELLGDPDPGRASRATQAMMTMKKIDIAALKRAADQE